MNPIGRNDPCPCGSGKKYKKCCMSGVTSTPPHHFADEEGVHVIGKGEKPNPEQIEMMEKAYQSRVRNSPLWNEMIEQYGLEKAEELLKEFKVKTK